MPHATHHASAAPSLAPQPPHNTSCATHPAHAHHPAVSARAQDHTRGPRPARASGRRQPPALCGGGQEEGLGRRWERVGGEEVGTPCHRMRCFFFSLASCDLPPSFFLQFWTRPAHKPINDVNANTHKPLSLKKQNLHRTKEKRNASHQSHQARTRWRVPLRLPRRRVKVVRLPPPPCSAPARGAAGREAGRWRAVEGVVEGRRGKLAPARPPQTGCVPPAEPSVYTQAPPH